MNPLFIVLFTITLFCHIARSVYEILKLNKRITPEHNAVFGFMLVVMLGMFASWFAMCSVDAGSLNVQPGLRSAGLAFSGLGVLLFLYSIIRLRTFDNYVGPLVQDGLYSKIRHPMYLGFIILFIGYPVYQDAKYALITSIIWIPNVLYWRKMEDKELERKYPEFQNYKVGTIF